MHAKRQRSLISVVIIFVFLYLSVLFWRGVKESIFFRRPDRINLLAFGVEPVIISLGLKDSVNYIARFDNGLKTYVPGGYGYYGIGSLVKLGQLEKDTDLLRRSFSLMSSADIDYYLYPKEGKIYHDTDFTAGFLPTKSVIISSLFSTDIMSNARFLDKLYLFLVVAKQRKIDYVNLKTSFVERKNDEKIFDSHSFFKEYQGFFYKKTLRDLDTTIQIRYVENIRAARNIARILEGEGVRVADIDVSADKSTICRIKYKNIESVKKHQITEIAILKVLRSNCKQEISKLGQSGFSDSFDMVVMLSPEIEENWK